MEKYLLLCDWGNSSFRLCLYNLAAEKIVDEIQSADGIAGIYHSWQNRQQNNNEISKEHLFRETLLRQVTVLSNTSTIDLSGTPIVISGMASSSIGIANIPYADTPFDLDGGQVKSRKFPAQANFPHVIFLISGVRGEQEVMRGEETQLIGIWSLLTEPDRPSEGIFIFPGTHSKHIYVKDEKLVHFSTFMTGELYQLLARHSILKDSVQTDNDLEQFAGNLQSFKKGVQQSLKAGLLNTLFTVRTNQLLNQCNKTENAFYLSGLLIGSELQELRKAAPQPLFLCSGKHLFGLYKIAMEELGLAGRTDFISPATVELAAMQGQKIIYTQYLKNKMLYE
jgi:2-dehydro-3-deoxygalactonokinase